MDIEGMGCKNGCTLGPAIEIAGSSTQKRNGPDRGGLGGDSSLIDVGATEAGAGSGAMFSLPFEGCFGQRVFDPVEKSEQCIQTDCIDTHCYVQPHHKLHSVTCQSLEPSWYWLQWRRNWQLQESQN